MEATPGNYNGAAAQTIPGRLVSVSSMSRSIHMDGQDKQDLLSLTGFSRKRTLLWIRHNYPLFHSRVIRPVRGQGYLAPAVSQVF